MTKNIRFLELKKGKSFYLTRLFIFHENMTKLSGFRKDLLRLCVLTLLPEYFTHFSEKIFGFSKILLVSGS